MPKSRDGTCSSGLTRYDRTPPLVESTDHTGSEIHSKPNLGAGPVINDAEDPATLFARPGAAADCGVETLEGYRTSRSLHRRSRDGFVMRRTTAAAAKATLFASAQLVLREGANASACIVYGQRSEAIHTSALFANAARPPSRMSIVIAPLTKGERHRLPSGDRSMHLESPVSPPAVIGRQACHAAITPSKKRSGWRRIAAFAAPLSLVSGGVIFAISQHWLRQPLSRRSSTRCRAPRWCCSACAARGARTHRKGSRPDIRLMA